jgi:hypothetical protein
MIFKDPKVSELFPTPIVFNNLDRSFTSEELQFVERCSLDTINNIGNKVSNNTYVLNDPAMVDIKKFIERNVEWWFRAIDDPFYEIKPYITQSWLNYTEQGGYHFKHTHPNSIVSGVFYINADKEKDLIYFSRTDNKQIAIEPRNFNKFNSPSWKFQIGTYDLIMFPSSLPHHVDSTSSSHTRISLAFNVFVQGLLGDEKSLSALHC